VSNKKNDAAVTYFNTCDIGPLAGQPTNPRGALP
jgi:hypothetical protein